MCARCNADLLWALRLRQQSWQRDAGRYRPPPDPKPSKAAQKAERRNERKQQRVGPLCIDCENPVPMRGDRCLRCREIAYREIPFTDLGWNPDGSHDVTEDDYSEESFGETTRPLRRS